LVQTSAHLHLEGTQQRDAVRCGGQVHQHFHLPRLEGRCKATWKRKLVGLQDLCFDNNPQWEPPLEVSSDSGNIDIRLPGKGNSDSHRARPVHLIISMIMWIRTSRLSIKNSVFTCGGGWGGQGFRVRGLGSGVSSSEMCTGSEAGLYFRRIDFCVTQL